MKINLKKRIYMDYAATAPELLAVRRACKRAGRLFGNPSSIHQDGAKAREALQTARKEVAGLIRALPDEIIFVGSGTESINLAIRGSVLAAGKKFSPLLPHVITTTIEHSAVIETCKALEREGLARVTYLAVEQDGRIDPKSFREALCSETVLVSVGYVNNEIGTIQPIKEIAKEIRYFKNQAAKTEEKKEDQKIYPLLHTDACQAAAYLSMNAEQLGADLISWNGTKIGGPRGVGVLYKKRTAPLCPVILGGGQEGGLRSGTENVSGIAGLACALEAAEKSKEAEGKRLKKIQEYFFSEIKKHFPEARINGSEIHRVCNNVHVSFPRFASELLVIELDAKGVSASAGSACGSARDIGSPVLAALYGEEDQRFWGSIRFSFGRETEKKDVSRVIKILRSIQKKYEIVHEVSN